MALKFIRTTSNYTLKSSATQKGGRGAWKLTLITNNAIMREQQPANTRFHVLTPLSDLDLFLNLFATELLKDNLILKLTSI